MKKFFFFLFFASFLIANLSALTYVDNCTDLNVTGETYMLSADIYSLSPVRMNCFDISAENVTLDGNGYTLYGDGAGKGVYSNQDGTIIQNLVSSGAFTFEPTIYFDGVDNGKIIFSNISASSVIDNPIILTGSSGNNISYNILSASGVSASDIQLLSSSNNNYVTNNKINAVGQNAYGIYVSSSVSNNIFYNNLTLTQSGSRGIQLVLSSNSNNISFNNIQTSTSTNVGGISLLSSSNNNLIADNTAYGTASSNNELIISGCSYNEIYRNNFTSLLSSPIYLDNSAYLTLINNTANTNLGVGFQLIATNRTNLTGNNAICLENCRGIGLRNSRYNRVENNYAPSYFGRSLGIDTDSRFNFVNNNNFTSTYGRGITLESSSYNNLTNNIASSVNWTALTFNQSSNNIAENNSLSSASGLDFYNSGSGNAFVNQDATEYTFSSASSFLVNSKTNGQILFTSPLTETGTNLSNDIQIAHNFAYVNSAKTGLNQTANVSLFNAGTFIDPAVYRDGLPCPAEICSNFQQNGNNFSFSVNAWSNYSIGEGNETCSICSETCSPCGNGCNATDLTNMYNSVSDFDATYGDITGWNTSCITNMRGMFSDSDFNQNISNWDVSSVTDMSELFAGSSFNYSICGWNTSSVTDMSDMFSNMNYNQDVNCLDVSKVTDMQYMFDSNPTFNKQLNNWNTSSVTDVLQMFTSATNFNQPLNNWDVSSITNFQSMFEGASSFNQDISGWDMSNAVSTNNMFAGAVLFNQDLGDWNISQNGDMDTMFEYTGLSRNNYDNILLGWSSQAPNIQSNVVLSAYPTQYSSVGKVGRDILTDTYGWVITDGGLNDTEIPEEETIEDNGIYNALNSSGAGLGIFFQILARVLPVLLIVITIFLIIFYIADSLKGLLKNYFRMDG